MERNRQCARALGWIQTQPIPIQLSDGLMHARIGWMDPDGREWVALPEFEAVILPDFVNSRDACFLFERALSERQDYAGRRMFTGYLKSVASRARNGGGTSALAHPKHRVDALLRLLPEGQRI